MIDDLRKKIEDAEDKILSLQMACSHPMVALSVVASSSFVTVYKCGLCEKADVRIVKTGVDPSDMYDDGM